MIMKNKLLFIAILIVINITAHSQQLPRYTQYMLNGFLINPALAGSDNLSPLKLTARQQWVGFEDAPSTQNLSVHHHLTAYNMGVGGIIFNDMFGAVRRTGLQLAYAYHIDMSKWDSKLSFGLSGSFFQYSLDKNNLRILDENDIAFSQNFENSFIPDLNFGFYLHNNKYFIGVSGNQLIEYNVKLSANNNDNRMVRHYYTTAGYKIPINGDILLEPSFLIKATETINPQVDINLKTYYKNDYWLGFSYRHSDAITALIGMKYNQFIIGYAFDFTLSNINQYSSGTHEIMLGVNLRNAVQGSTLF